MNAAQSSAQTDGTLQVWLFESVFRAFAAGNVTFDDVLGRLRRLLATGMPAAELLEIVRRTQSSPESAQPVVDFLNDAMRGSAREAVEAKKVQPPPHAPAPSETIESRQEIKQPPQNVIEEKLAGQRTDHELSTRSGGRNGKAERDATARASEISAANATTLTLAADLADARAALTAQERRTRDLSTELAEKDAALEGSRTRVAEILRDYERQRNEAQTLRNSLEARDADLDKMQAALERHDTEVAALHQEHATAASTLEARAGTAERLGADLQAALARAEAASSELKEGQEARGALEMNLKRSESRLNAALTELDAAKTQSSSYLELIRTREWRRGFDHNMMRDLDMQVREANAKNQALESQRDRLQSDFTAAESERARLTAELAARDRAHAAKMEQLQAEAQARAHAAAQNAAELKRAADVRQTELTAQTALLRAEHASQLGRMRAELGDREERIGALIADLKEAHRPVQLLESERDRLRSELTAAESARARLAADLAAREREHAAQLGRVRAELQERETAAAQSAAKHATQLEQLHAAAQEHATAAAQNAAESTEISDLRQTELTAQIAQLRAEHAAQVERMQAEAHLIKVLESERDRLQSDLAAADNERARLAARNREHTAQLGRVQAEVQERETAAAQSAAEAKSASDLLQTEFAAQIAQLHAEHTAQVERVRAEARRPIQALESKLDRLQTKLTAADNERALLAAELAARDQEHAAQLERIQAESQERETAAAQSAAGSKSASDLRQTELTAQIAQLRAEHTAEVERMRAEARRPIQALESKRDRLQSKLTAADSERKSLAAELAARDRAHAATIEQLQAEAQSATDLRQTELAAQIGQLRTEHAAQLRRMQAELADREERVGVLIASLKEARRPIPDFEADVKRLTEELAAKTGTAAALDRQTRKVAALLEWTRNALEECELIVRQLGPGESANVLGQIQTSIIKRLKFLLGRSAAADAEPCDTVPGAANRSAALVKIDGGRITTHLLAARTRIGRSAACELLLDSSSVSRHHALVIVGPRYTVVEDLNSTNGVLVNGRKVKRLALNDGDTLTIGDTRFRYLAPLHDFWTRPNPADFAAPHHVIQ